MKKTTPLAILTLAVFALSGPLQADTYTREESRECSADSITKVLVEGYAADIDVAGWDQNRITVDVVMTVNAADEDKAEKVFEQTELVFKEDEGKLKIALKGKNDDGGWSLFGLFKKSPGASITVRVPHQIDLSLDTGSGNIKANEVFGNLKLDSGSGNITGNQLGGEIRADTGSGDVQLTGVEGTLKGDTGSGNIKVSELSGVLNADTGSGDVKASGAISRFNADTGSGNVSVTSSVVLEENSRATTGSGNVRVELPAGSAFSLGAGTGSGNVNCSFTVTDAKTSKNSLSGQVNGGGPKLAIATGSGDINVVAN